MKKLSLQTIVDLKMSSEEAETFKLALIYENEFSKIFKNIDGQTYRRNFLPRKKDPRDSYLFRQCWKLRRETRDLLEPSEYKNYIQSNLFIIKTNEGHIQPNCINGDKSWIRYKVWKRIYDKKLAEKNSKLEKKEVKLDHKKLAEIDKTKKFLFEKCKGTPKYEQILDFIQSGSFNLWIATEKISPFYLSLSIFIDKAGMKNKLFSFSKVSEGFIKEKTTKDIIDYFEKEFDFERF